MIDLTLFDQQCCRLSPRQEISRTKLVHDQLSVQDPLLSLCPCCKCKVETTDHSLRCHSCPHRASHVKALKAAICTDDIHPVRYILRLAGILHWHDHSDSVPLNPSLLEYDPAFLIPLLWGAI